MMDIDYIGILDYIRDYSEVPYSDPEKDGISSEEKRRLLAIKEKGQYAVTEMTKVAVAIADKYKLNKARPLRWLDFSNTKTKKYLWAQMKYASYVNHPVSISLFAEKNDSDSSLFRISLEIKNDTASKEEMVQYHSHLDIPLDKNADLVYVSGSNEWGLPAILSESQSRIKEMVSNGDLRKVQVCKYIERKKDETNEYYQSEIFKAIEALIPYYNHAIGFESSSYWPSLDQYDPGISSEKWLELLLDPEITKESNLEMFKMMLELGGESTCANLAEKYGGSPSTYNVYGRSFAQRVQKKTGCPLCKDGTYERVFVIPFVGRNVNENGSVRYSWKLRDELMEALEVMDLSDIKTNKIAASSSIEFDKNTILFGPPGTGKTYYTAIYAVAICDNKTVEELKDYDKVMARYKELKSQHRIAFTTFHQSYGYEEFIEGIRPKVDNEESEISYAIEPGVFKAFCERAKIVQEDDIEYTGTVWAVRNRAGDKDVPSDFEDRLYQEGVIKLENTTDINRQNNFLNDMMPGDWVVLGRLYDINAIGIVIDDTTEEIEDGIFHVQRRIEWKLTGVHEDCRSINRGKGFSNFSVAKSAMKIQDLQRIVGSSTPNAQPYVFIIDEINRGNISKIFGELITLIENTKREGMPEAASATLPYSGEEFSVPSNIYILGTMNTADRSIALMDTALRRRFHFVEMMPKSDVLREIGADKIRKNDVVLDVAAMLDVINERIAFLYDREHTIGHAFFTCLSEDPSIDKLSSIFKKSVVPLLQEYFYEDYQKIQLVLGDNAKTEDAHKFVKDTKFVSKTVFKGSVDDDIDLPEKKYEVNEEAFANILSYIEIM